MSHGRVDRDPRRPVYVISVAASIVAAHPRTLRIYEDEGLVCPARTATNIRLYSDEDIRRITWIRHLTQDRGVNLAGIRLDRKSTRLNSSHSSISYAVFCLKKKNKTIQQ